MLSVPRDKEGSHYRKNCHNFVPDMVRWRSKSVELARVAYNIARLAVSARLTRQVLKRRRRSLGAQHDQRCVVV